MARVVISAIIPGTDGFYKARSDGTIWSRHIRGGRNNSLKGEWQKLKPSTNTTGGYPFVRIKIKGKWKCVKVHKLILLAFRGPCPKGMESRHYPNNDRTNCQLSNLRYGTKEENDLDKVEHGTICKGEINGMSVLSWKEVKLLRRLRKAGHTIPKICRMVSRQFGTVKDVIQGKTWIE
jgi:hypothetical protein